MEAITETRKGDWIETYTGKRFYPLDPRPEDVSIIDIAHALSLVCRFNGHVRHHYSVAQHSVLCACHVINRHGNRAALYALLHDAAEAYVCDIPRPFKGDIGGYAKIEASVQAAILQAFGLPPMTEAQHAIVKEADDIALYNEATALLSVAAWVPDIDFPKIQIEHMQPESAEKRFSALFSLLINRVREELAHGTDAGA